MVKIKDKYKEYLLGYWDFRTGSLVDFSGNGNDGIPTSVRFGNESGGRGIITSLNAPCSVSFGNDNSLNIGTDDSFTIFIQLKRYSKTKTAWAISKFSGSKGFALRYDSSNNIDFVWGDGSSVSARLKLGFGDGIHTVILRYDKDTDTGDGYIEGNPSVSSDTQAYDDDTGALKIGAENSVGSDNSDFCFLQFGILKGIAISNADAVQLTDEIEQESSYDLAELNRYKKPDGTLIDCYITRWGHGWNESISNETSGFLSNTCWKINSGTWKVSNRSGYQKVLECVADGQLQYDGIKGADTWTTNDFEHVSGTATLTKADKYLQIDAVAGDKVGNINLTSATI